MAAYKLIALDLDGTLLDSSLRLSDANAEALRQAIAAGVQVVLATSRWYGLAKRTADRLGISTPLICSNGAIVKRPADGKELLHLYLDRELARAVTEMGDDAGWEMFTTVGDATYMRMRPGVIPEKLPAGLRVAERQSDRLDEAEPTCVLVFGEPAVNQIEERFLPLYAKRASFSVNRPVSLPHYVVLTHAEADKAGALDLVCRELGIPPEQTVAMGDSESDADMLRYAGLGIAMGNAPDAVKREALHIAPSNNEDGVAWAVGRFLL
ncbi:MAG: Cof-type HAD-IIB family hydrolase [Dehalococcoidia bacterium]|nr:Cof-type HAD-IIB family hydrolase [Dehalococcoidia bacterium]